MDKCRTCGKELKILGLGFYGDTIEVECVACGDTYEVEPDGLGEGGLEFIEAQRIQREFDILEDRDNQKNKDIYEMFGEPVNIYTRAQAIEDGVLVDISDYGSEMGLKYPSAVTNTLYEKYLNADNILKEYGQSTKGRILDMLTMFVLAVKNAKTDTDTIIFKTIFFNRDLQEELVKIKCIIGPGDDPKPVFTFMFPEED